MRVSRSVVRAFVYLIFSISCIALLGSAWNPPADNPNAVWVAEQHDVLKVSSANGAVRFELPNTDAVRALTVDPLRGRLWTYDQTNLQGYDPDGGLRVVQPIAVPSALVDKDARVLVDSQTGTVWLLQGYRILQLSSDGVLTSEIDLPSEITAASVDQKRGELWVASGTVVRAYALSGNLVAQFSVDAPISALSFASDIDGIWAAAAKVVRRYDRTGSIVFTLARSGIARVAADRSGVVWLADKQNVLRLDALGSVSFEIDPLSGNIVDLAVDPSDGSAWIASAQELLHLSAQGGTEHFLTLRGSEFTGRVWVLGLFSDVVKPTLSIESPENEAFRKSGDIDIKVTFKDEGSGVDADSLGFLLVESPLEVTCTYEDAAATCNPQTPLPDGEATLRATIKDLARNEAISEPVNFTVDSQAPTISVEQPGENAVVNTVTVTLQGLVTDDTSGIAEFKVSGVSVPLDVNHRFSYLASLEAEGENAFQLSAKDRAGNETIITKTIIRDTIAPPAANTQQIAVVYENDHATLTGAAGSVEGNAFVRITNKRTGESVRVKAAADGSFIASLNAMAGDLFEIVVEDGAGNASESKPIAASDVPPDPASFAPVLDATVATTVYDAAKFLYTGQPRLQTGMLPETIERRRAAVIRGHVMTRDSRPLSGVKITIFKHPEYGETMTRADGAFDMVVNGGSRLTIDYRKDGYFSAQRKVNAPWQDYVWATDVVLVEEDDRMDTVVLSRDSLQVARGSQVAVEFGSRRATILFPAGTAATMTLEDGSQQQLTTLDVRATEYTVGSNGLASMPGELPTFSGYTYAVELSADQAIEAGATRVDFSQPVSFYVENFLGFPVGEIVPAGWYDRTRAAWIPSQNGRIIKVLSEVNSAAVLDVDGSAQPASAEALSSLGITEEERAKLAELYQPGDILWRVPMKHFTPWDCNWPFGFPSDATAPPNDAPSSETGADPNTDLEPECPGCKIYPFSQVIEEEMPLVGVPYSLVYRSDRMPGWLDGGPTMIQLSGSSIPSSLKEIRLTITIAGQRIVREFPAEPNLSYEFTWDGRDAYGRPVSSVSLAHVDVDYVYEAVYYPANDDFERELRADH